MKASQLIKLIRSTILYNIDLGTLAEVEIRRHGKLLGNISDYKCSEYNVFLYDSKYNRNKMKVIDLLAALRNANDSRGRSDKEVIYSQSYGNNLDIVSVYFKLERSGHQVKYIKFYVNVQ
jgi:hypothetical protein